MLTALVMIPLMGGLAIAVDYAEMSSQRQATLNALDAAGIATARRIAEGASDAEVLAYAQDFFDANLTPVVRENARLNVVLPGNHAGGGTLKLSADLDYTPTFYPVLKALLGEKTASTKIKLDVQNEIRLKNTLEVALVLDNSGSMDQRGSGSGRKRLDLLKDAAKELVSTLAAQAGMMKQVAKPVQFGLVPFAASVNVGPGHADADWMDKEGLSPVHHENFDWSTMPEGRKVEKAGGVYRKTGTDWGQERGRVMSRFELFADVRKKNASVSWGGCVEMRPYPYNLNNAPANPSIPETLFVPMFAPDEPERVTTDRRGRTTTTSSYNSWLPDETENSNMAYRQTYMQKYYTAGTVSIPNGKGPNQSCTTTPITPLTDVTIPAGLLVITNAINGMRADGATNVPEGLAWGWRVVSGSAPFTQGRPDNERGNDKVVIVLTDGANTYYTPQSLGGTDLANNRSTYSNYGYAKTGRIFAGTSVNRNDYSNTNYTRAMNQQFATLCNNAKNNDIILITVALDLSLAKTDEREQIDALKACASESRFRKDPETGQPAKLFWNATGADLADKFKEIADELSNLRIVG